MIDLRSDTVTRPTSDMKEAMFQAMVGDDVYGEDPTINALQEKAAKMFGMEAALFCPSGTMCNQVAIKLSTQPQDEVICDKWAHVYLYEGGGMMANSMVSVRLLDGDRMRISPQQVEAAINPENLHFPISRLVCLENTCNKGGGSYYTMDEIKAISEVCRDNHLRLHVDGARIFNALTETGDDPRDYGKYINTLSFCLSKGLGAPVGSMLVGSHDDIKKALRIRKMMGGGMRQAGYLAAAGIYALDHHVERLKEDHENARCLAKAMEDLNYITNIRPVETNIVIFDIVPPATTQEFLQYLEKNGVKGSAFGQNTIRFVTHLDVNADMIDKAIKVLQGFR